MIVNPYAHADWAAIAPLLLVAGTALLVLFADLVTPRGSKRYVSIAVGIAGLLVSAAFCARGYGSDYSAFHGGFVLGGFAVVFEEIIVLSTVLSVAFYGVIGRETRIAGAVALMLWGASGAMLMAGSANLMTIFLGLEILSLALYCLCGLGDRPASRESALKYLILSSTASGFMLYGMALLFGASGDVTLASLAVAGVAGSPLFWLGTGLLFVGIAFKLSLIPFHVWTPDVYEGAPLPVTAFMSVVTKAGTLAVFARFAYAVLPHAAAGHLLLPVWILAGVSMIGGNVAMLSQTDMKRLLGYSGIAQAGYMVAALAGGSTLGLRYAVFYLAAYALMNMGAFAVVSILSGSGEEEASSLEAFRGLGKRRPALAAAMTFFLLALAGFPPTAGFLGKILILSSTVSTGYAWLGFLLIAGTAVSLYAYFKVVRLMYDRGGKTAAERGPVQPLAWLGLWACLAGVLALTFYPLTPSNILPLLK